MQGETLVNFLLEKFPEIRTVGDDPKTRPGIVHRLDKDTSGVMIVARNQKSFDALKDLFQKRLVEKIYIAVVCGIPKEKSGIISLPVGRLVNNPIKRGVMQGKSHIRGAREAFTEFEVLETHLEYSFLKLIPKTGRMHQIRVHLKSIGHPVACDKLYGGKNVCCPKGIKRHLLHAKSISFSFPAGKRLRFEADPPEDFSAALKLLR